MVHLQAVFCENLKAARKEAGLTQDALAEKVGIAPKYLGVIERGIKFPSIQMLERISDALGLAPYRLFIEPSQVPGMSKVEIVSAYNRLLSERLVREIKTTSEIFLTADQGKEETAETKDS